MIEMHFPSFIKCQSDSLCSKSSAFTKHQFPLIISLFILHLMMQPGLENSYDLYCSSKDDRSTHNEFLTSLLYLSYHTWFPSQCKQGLWAVSPHFLYPVALTQPWTALNSPHSIIGSPWIRSSFFFSPPLHGDSCVCCGHFPMGGGQYFWLVECLK